MKCTLFLAATLLLCPVGERVGFAQIAVAKSEEELRNRDATAAALVRLIDSEISKRKALNLPPKKGAKFWSWEVSYQPQYNLVEVQCNQAVLMEPEFAFNSSINEKREPALRHPKFSFRAEPFVSPKEYNRFKAENDLIDKQLKRMPMFGIRQKFDSFSPRNEEEKKKVDEYNRLKKSRHDLPDFYFRNISVSWVWFPGCLSEFRRAGENPRFIAETDEKEGWQREQADTAQAVLKLLSRYEPEQK